MYLSFHPGGRTSDADVKNRSTHERDNNMQRVSDVVLLFSCLIIFTHMKLWIASARHNFKWVEIIYSICFLSMAGIVRGICTIFLFLWQVTHRPTLSRPPAPVSSLRVIAGIVWRWKTSVMAWITVKTIQTRLTVSVSIPTFEVWKLVCTIWKSGWYNLLTL